MNVFFDTELKFQLNIVCFKKENVNDLIDFICLFFAGTNSSPDEDRLLKHLFHPDHQTHNLMTTPIANRNQTVHVGVGIDFLKLIGLVS